MAPATASVGVPLTVTSSSLGTGAPTFVGPAALGCNHPDCALLSGPFGPYTPNSNNVGAQGSGDPLAPSGNEPNTPQNSAQIIDPTIENSDLSTIPTISCEPLGPGCDNILSVSGGATGVKGLNAVSSATLYNEDVEPADQGLCANAAYAVETNNIGEVLIFNSALDRLSLPLSLDSLMGLTERGWSSGGDPSCLFDYSNGGHWFFTEIVSDTNESIGGTFAGCFAGLANACYEGIAVSEGPNPMGPYDTYFLNANYNPYEPGYPYQLNDFAKIATSQDAFLVFYDEFPLFCGGFGLGCFNGAQELAFDKNALETWTPTHTGKGAPNHHFNVAVENMGLLATPNGICPSDDIFHAAGITCWYAVIPAQSPDPAQFDNAHGGTAFMLESLDFYGAGDTRIAVFDFTDLSALNSKGCTTCGGIEFGGQLFSGVDSYYNPGIIAPQKAGPIPLGHECGKAGLTNATIEPKCPEGGIATNGDDFTQVSYANGQLWGSLSTLVDQTYTTPSTSWSEFHMGVAYYVVGTASFDSGGAFTLTSEGYVTAAHEELEFPAIGAEGTSEEDGGNGMALITFSLSGNGGPNAANHGGFFPSSAYGWLTSTSAGLVHSTIFIADKGRGAQDGFTEYQGLPGATRPRWGDYSWAIYVPYTDGTVYFATNYIQSPNCMGHAFTLTIGTCGGTRNGFANWGTSVNFVS
ncbi:MAG: hypothetical protein WCB19_10915 [Thermoplasmata archaeon]